MKNFLQELQESLKNYNDIQAANYHHLLTYHYPAICDTQYIREIIIPHLLSLTYCELGIIEKVQDCSIETFYHLIFTGYFLIISETSIYKILVKKVQSRIPESPPNEVIITGSRDNFVEDIDTNLSLLRKRIPSYHLKCINYTMKKTTLTKVSLLYMEDCPEKLVQLVKEKIKNLLDQDCMNVGQIIELLCDRKKTLFPLLNYTSHPDFSCQSLLTSRFVILVDTIPLAIIGPVNLFLFTNFADSVNESFYVAILDRFIHYIALFISLFLLGFMTALLSFDPEFLPFIFLANVFNTRIGISMPIQFEFMIVDTFLQLFRIAGTRSLSGVNNALLIMGSIIIGQISVSAGIFSQTSLIITAVSVISCYLVSNNLSLNTSINIFRLFIFFSSALFGMLGFALSSIITIIYLASLDSFGTPVLSPIAPSSFKNLKNLFIPKSLPKGKKK